VKRVIPTKRSEEETRNPIRLSKIWNLEHEATGDRQQATGSRQQAKGCRLQTSGAGRKAQGKNQLVPMFKKA